MFVIVILDMVYFMKNDTFILASHCRYLASSFIECAAGQCVVQIMRIEPYLLNHE